MANDVRLVGGCKPAAHPRLSYFQTRDLISTSERFKCASESEAEAGRKNVMHEKSGAVWAGGGGGGDNRYCRSGMESHAKAKRLK